MQFSNVFGQYANASSTTAVTSKMGTQRLASNLNDLQAGNIFEGTVNSVKGGRVMLGLSNGSQLSARLDGTVSLNEGQSLFFQVKSNDGATIAIRPFTVEGTQVNLTLMSALSAANIPIDEENLKMVNLMMEKAMPIDRDSLTQMTRLVANHPTANVETLVEMQNLKLPVTPQMISQFENYANDKQAITNELTKFMENLPEAIANDKLNANELSQMAGKVLSVITEGLEAKATSAAFPTATSAENAINTVAGAFDEVIQPELVPNAELSGEAVQMPEAEEVVTTQTGAVAAGEGEEGFVEQKAEGEAVLSSQSQETNSQSASPAPGSLGAMFNSNQMAVLTNNLFEASLLPDNQILEKDMNAMQLLSEVAKELPNLSNADKDSLMKLFLSAEFKELTKEAMQQQWTLKPEDLAGKDSEQISKLYSHLKDQLDRIELAVKATGQDSTAISSTAEAIRNNVDFMNQVNETYQYVQIPLQMNGKNAAGELYVFTNKRAISEEGELSAFLHLDMEHLGSTDVSVRMKNKEVNTKFYFDNDASYALIEKYSDVLAERLKKKGYHCKVEVVNEGKHLDFVDDFLKKDEVNVGLLHRYSFDMRA